MGMKTSEAKLGKVTDVVKVKAHPSMVWHMRERSGIQTCINVSLAEQSGIEMEKRQEIDWDMKSVLGIVSLQFTQVKRKT